VTFERLLTQLLTTVLGVTALAIPFMVLERLIPRRPMKVRGVLLKDILHAVGAAALSAPLAYVVYDLLISRMVEAGIFDYEPTPPFWVIGPLTIIGMDFSMYWIHRAMHTKLLWRIHRWHHSPRHMYWLAGFRSTFFHNFLVYFMGACWAMAMRIPPVWLPAGGVASILSNHWMHTNIRGKWPRLEKVIITPRSHGLHHSSLPEHHHGNYGAFFSVWDRQFGTYVDPDIVGEPSEFGISDDVSTARLVIGV
jgi:sterol desaturase/sphingolipid hydroxylase (fatty acid hydroxylase superfamily)